MYNHKAHSKTHALARAEERYGKRPVAIDFEDMRNQIVQGRAVLVDDQAPGIKGVYKVQFRGEDAWVVYHHLKRKVVTFLPKNPVQARNGTPPTA